ncbi:hypothetical protein [Aquimarina sp. I32.4]|uniref:hypothetical protein n=1 Tax=Aquimarina sp. I32.4 TaxID=2053903 RepID=UPI000CDF24A5|nr:hypothetical protein [Aquimarina sp. I32.4]
MNNKTNTYFDHPIKKRVAGTQKSFGVEIMYSATSKIQYVIDVAYAGYIDDDYQCILNRNQFFINGQQPKRLLEVLAEKCMNSIYPIQLKVSPFGFIQDFLNFEEIQKRWDNALLELKREYDSEFTDQYFEQISQNLSSKDSFVSSIGNDLIFYLLFFKIPALYEKAHIKHNMIWKIPTVAYAPPVEFIGDQKINLNAPRGIHLEFEGKDIKNNILSLTHLINQDDYTVIKINGTLTTPNQTKQTEYRITHLAERDKKYVEKAEEPEVIPKEMIKKKKWFPLLVNRIKKI